LQIITISVCNTLLSAPQFLQHCPVALYRDFWN